MIPSTIYYVNEIIKKKHSNRSKVAVTNVIIFSIYQKLKKAMLVCEYTQHPFHFKHKDISDFMKLFAVMTKLLYAVTITVSYQMPLSSCLSLFHIICRIGTKIYEIERNVTCINYNTPMIGR